MKTCNQCQKEMEYSLIIQTKIDVEVERNYLHFCNNPACPNFALLQVPVEDLPSKDFGKVKKGRK